MTKLHVFLTENKKRDGISAGMSHVELWESREKHFNELLFKYVLL